MRARGFTLLELLVVLFVIGVAGALAVLAAGDGGREARLQTEADRLAAAIDLLGQDAVLVGRVLGLAVESSGWSARAYGDGAWRPLADARRPLAWRLPPGLMLEPAGAPGAGPALVFGPDGITRGAPLRLHDRDAGRTATITPRVTGLPHVAVTGP